MHSDEIVISGVSGRFPESASMKELRDNLFSNVNMVTTTERSFKPGVFGIPMGFGAMKNINKFDAEFFGVHPKQASRTDPQLRMSLETTAEALFDAGINPDEQRGSRTGVYVGVTSSEAYDMWTRQPSKTEGVTMVGCAKSMFANRISYAFDFRGPSCSYDTACSSSLVALEAAFSDLKSGKCDAAIVTGGNLIMNPLVTLQFYKLGVLSRDSASKAFDESANGYARAEAVATIYLQRRCNAKRIYASIINIRCGTDGFKSDGIATPSSVSLETLLNRVYSKAGVDKKEVSYIECHGTGTQAGDLQEFLAIQRSFAESLINRPTPLRIGGVKSNLGHAEGASGVCGIAKVLIMLQEGVIPANLHYKTPQLGMEYLHNGKIKVVDEHVKWEGGLIGLNSFGFGGVNVHMILKPFDGNNMSDSVISALPKILTLSGRTEEIVLKSLVNIEEENNINMWNLLNDSYKSHIHGHLFRGYSIPGVKPPTVKATLDTQGPANVWLVFNGIGSQWIGMGRDLLKIPTFAESIKILTDCLFFAFGYDLMQALLESDSSVIDTPLYCFVTIAAIQIGIVDLLKKLGVQMQGFIGHSAGEMICAYADGCLTAQETIQCAYYRGASLASTNNEGVEMRMAVIGAAWEEVSANCPKGVYPACHNAPNSVTVSGPAKLVDTYVADMKAKGRQANKSVNSCGQAFHSPYIEKSSQTFLANLKTLIKEPTSRSSKWISSSISGEDWSTELALKASPEYFVNNFRNPVLFYDAISCIPANSVVVEIGPSGLLQGLIKKSAPKNTQVFALQSRNSEDALVDFVSGLGNLFMAGVEMDVNALYGDVQFPVPLGTPMISPHITWDHRSSWDVPVFGHNGEFVEGSFDVDISKEAYKYLAGHQIQGRILMPASGYLLLVWKFFASIHQIAFDKLPVIFENVKYTRVTLLREFGKVEFRVNVSDLSGYFEIKEGDAVIVTGYIRRLVNEANNELLITEEEMAKLIEKHNKDSVDSTEFDLLKADIYKQFRFLGYEYKGYFVGINRWYSSGKFFSVDWKDNWVAFLDIFSQTSMGLFGLQQTQTQLPTEFAKMVISPQTLLDYIVNNVTKDNGVLVHNDRIRNIIRCPGLELQGWKFTPIQAAAREPVPDISSYEFRPFFDNKTDESILNPILQYVRIIMDSIPHNLLSMTLNVVEFTSSPDNFEPLKTQQYLRVDCAVSDVNYNVFSNTELEESQSEKYAMAGVDVQSLARMDRTAENHGIIITDGIMEIDKVCHLVSDEGFVILNYPISEYSTEEVEKKCETVGLTLISHKTTAVQDVFLTRKTKKPDSNNVRIVFISSKTFEWIEQLREILIAEEEAEGNSESKIYLISNGDEEDSGIIGLINCIRKEPFCQQVRAVLSKKKLELNFESPSPLLAKIMAQDLVITVVDSDGNLGSYVYSPVPIGKDVDSKNAFVGIQTVGDFSTLRWIQGFSYDQLQPSSCPGFLPIRVKVAALNFKDIMLASGTVQPEKHQLPFKIESPLGIEFAGETVDGARVAGFVVGQALATNLLASKDWIWNVPKSWSIEDAATFPVAYCTAYMALVVRGQIQEGESILIHASSDEVAQASIHLALSLNCEIYTTVDSKEKRDFIQKTFPKIPSKNIGFSGHTTFEKMVMEGTDGRGVDLVLNSLAGDLLEASTRCLARHGRFLEIGKPDLASNKAFGTNFFARDASYHAVMFDSLWDASPGYRRQLWKLVQNGLESGVVVPLPHTTFSHDQVEDGFRFMAKGKHIGKVLINLENIKELLPANPRIYFDPIKTYIIIGGLGGMAVEYVNWMITRYARKFILTTRTGIINGYQANYIKIWKNAGVDVHVLTLDAADPVQAEQLINKAKKIGPVGGFFNLAMQMKIDLMKSQTLESFEYAMDPKYILTLNIDKLTRKKCPALDHFVVFSSVTVGFGFPGQTNYGFANSAMEKIVERRNEEGFPGKAIQFGPVGEVGKWHEHYNPGFELKKYQGHGVQSIGSILKAMDTLLTHPAPVMLSRQAVEVDSAAKFAKGRVGIVERIAYVLGHSSTQSIDQNAKLAELGMDSVTATEVKQMLEHEFDLILPAGQIRASTLMQLKQLAATANSSQTAKV